MKSLKNWFVNVINLLSVASLTHKILHHFLVDNLAVTECLLRGAESSKNSPEFYV